MVVCKPTDQLLGCLCLCCTWPPSKMLFLVFFCLALFLYGTSGDTVDTPKYKMYHNESGWYRTVITNK